MLGIFAMLMKYPSILHIITGKRLVLEVSTDGGCLIRKAKDFAGAMKTKRGYYFYERNATVSLHGKPMIMANAGSDAKAIRPDLQPVFSLLKRKNIQNRESLLAFLNAPLISKKKYESLMKIKSDFPDVEIVGDVNE